MLTLYHNNISVCAQKVRLLLVEKGIPWEGREVDLMRGEQLAPAFLAVNPKGLVPVLVHDGDVITESTVILEYVEDAFPAAPLRPAAPLGRARMRVWTKVPDEGLHFACGTLTFATAFIEQIRGAFDRDAWEKRLAAMPDPARAARQRQLFQEGLAAPFVRDAVLLHDKVLGEMEKALATGAWLGGDDFSLADIALTPYVTRLDRLGLDGMWAARPPVADWFARIQARPSFAAAITAFQPLDYDDELKKRGIDVWPQVAKLLRPAAA
jgi:glutathione S-transferase